MEDRHYERWAIRTGARKPSPAYLQNLKDQILKIKEMKERELKTNVNGISHTQETHDNETPKEEDDPLQRAAAHRIVFERMQKRRRVVIPYQPSTSEIHHSYYPSDVFVQYSFVLQTQRTPSLSIMPSLRYRISSKRVQDNVPARIAGYTVNLKKPKKESAANRERILPIEMRRKVVQWRISTYD